ncbi:MAG: DUF3943 domain-containing protein [Verrucomicrobia bacterium]|nr:DUF3943 domain-containing protein [Verrucomicrobiota bacterium]
MNWISIILLALSFRCVAQAFTHGGPTLDQLADTASDTAFAISDQDTLESLRDSLNPTQPYWLPVSEGIGFNLLLGAFNAYVSNEHFAKISWKTIGDNFRRGFAWDADNFSTNQFAHPYHGGLYYNFARSAGYGYWPSLGVATIGSWQWEFFMENEPPAVNDWIKTSVGGAFLGEITYRLSSMIIDETATGSERAWREIAAFVVSPARGFNRLIFGRTSRTTSTNVYETGATVGNFAFGANNIGEGTDLKSGTKNPLLSIDFNYGQPFKKRLNKPFDFFRVHLGLNFRTGNPLGFVYGYGVLHSKRLTYENNRRLVLGFFQHFDYLSNAIYEIGATSFAGGLLYKTRFVGSDLYLAGHLGPILMGGANSEFAKEFTFDDRVIQYNMGIGAQSKFEAILAGDWGNFYLAHFFWWIHTLNGAPGDEFIGILKPRITVRVYNAWALGLEYLLYHRTGLYEDFPDVDLRNNEQRLFIALYF